MKKFIGFLRLTRPANIVTAISDILAGAAIATVFVDDISLNALFLLVLATLGLYGGGVVFNDVFDANLDREERPERPIPSGLVSVKQGAILGFVLLVIGIISALLVAIYPSGVIAFAIAIAALVYDKWGKHHAWLGPLNMGLCRGLNLLLGMSLSASVVMEYEYLAIAIVPVLYIGAITMISQGEVHGGRSTTMLFAVVLYGIVMAAIFFAAYVNGNQVYTLIFLLAFGLMAFPPLFKAMREPSGKLIGRAVRAGVLSLILMNACWAAAFGAFFFALIILLLLPLSILLARLFAVT